jgi:hypothetical protein
MGPWTEWINLFERWLATGSDTEPGHHLLLAKPDGECRVQSIGGDKRRLTVKGDATQLVIHDADGRHELPLT